MTIHREGYPTLVLSFILLFILTVSCKFFFPALLLPAVVLSVALWLFLVSFFRKPDRSIVNNDNNSILSPCDGKVVVIEKVHEPEYLNGECLMISVFMSPLNVHINWYPTDAVVEYYKYHPGKYLAAWNPKASTENERTTVCYNIHGSRLLLRQVAGALARRIVCYAVEGKSYKQGDEMGFIKFGSRVDIYLPISAIPYVKIGDKVTGNRTVLALFQK